MANAGQKRKEPPEGAAASSAPSLLGEAVAAYQRGDMVRAREAAQRALTKEPGAPAAKVFATRVLGPATENATVGAVAQALLERTRVPSKAYLFALLCAAVFVLLVVLAAART